MENDKIIISCEWVECFCKTRDYLRILMEKAGFPIGDTGKTPFTEGVMLLDIALGVLEGHLKFSDFPWGLPDMDEWTTDMLDRFNETPGSAEAGGQDHGNQDNVSERSPQDS